LRKRIITLTILAAVLLAPSMIFAASASMFAAGKAVTSQNSANEIVVPLVVTNKANLTAMDIPLKFSEGVTLKEVNFENVRTSYFDLKIANIDNKDHKVIIGLLPQMSAAAKPDLAAGTGPVANLVFQVDDPTITDIQIESFETENPGHALMYVYHDTQNGVLHQYSEYPEFSPITVSMSGVAGGPNMPTSFALNQNYPNPFNPTTQIAFDLANATHVELTIYNVLGQEVKTLVNRDMEAGSHSVEWDASNVSSGVYFYRIQAGDFNQTKKMMLLK
jgi:hypothetical protein